MSDNPQAELEANSEAAQKDPASLSGDTSSEVEKVISIETDSVANAQETEISGPSPIKTSSQAEDTIDPVTKQDVTPASALEDEITPDNEKQIRERIKEKPREPDGILIQCLRDIFEDEPTLKTFVAGNFKVVYQTYSERKFLEVITGLVQHCNSHGEIQYLWKRIKEEREKKYEFWYTKWKFACETYQSWERDSEQENISDQYDHSEVANFRTTKLQAVPSGDQDQSHPLSKDDSVVQEWFFNSLTLPQQSYTITVALFQGINRTQIDHLAQELQDHLFDSQEGTSNE